MACESLPTVEALNRDVDRTIAGADRRRLSSRAQAERDRSTRSATFEGGSGRSLSTTFSSSVLTPASSKRFQAIWTARRFQVIDADGLAAVLGANGHRGAAAEVRVDDEIAGFREREEQAFE